MLSLGIMRWKLRKREFDFHEERKLWETLCSTTQCKPIDSNNMLSQLCYRSVPTIWWYWHKLCFAGVPSTPPWVAKLSVYPVLRLAGVLGWRDLMPSTLISLLSELSNNVLYGVFYHSRDITFSFFVNQPNDPTKLLPRILSDAVSVMNSWPLMAVFETKRRSRKDDLDIIKIWLLLLGF